MTFFMKNDEASSLFTPTKVLDLDAKCINKAVQPKVQSDVIKLDKKCLQLYTVIFLEKHAARD